LYLINEWLIRIPLANIVTDIKSGIMFFISKVLISFETGKTADKSKKDKDEDHVQYML